MKSKIIITIATLLYGIAPLFADLNATHAFHPDWTPHSKLHMVWLLATNASIAVLALWLLWKQQQLVLPAILGFCVMTGFWLAVASKQFYAGALSDPGGVDINILGIEGNAFLFGIIVIMLAAGIALRPKPE